MVKAKKLIGDAGVIFKNMVGVLPMTEICLRLLKFYIIIGPFSKVEMHNLYQEQKLKLNYKH